MIRDIKMHSFLFTEGYTYSKFLGGKQLKQGHLSIGSWKWMLMEVIFRGKNVLSVLREWKKPYVKMSGFHNIHIESCVNEKC